MKHILAVIPLFLLLTLLAGCGQRTRVEAQLDTLDLLVAEHPDSVMAVLEALKDTMDGQPEHLRMRFGLLYVKAFDKTFVHHQTDSIILPVVQYYEQHRDLNLTPEAYYYTGRVYTEMGDALQAMDYFNKALTCIPDRTNSRKLRKLHCLCNAQMGQLFFFQSLYSQSLKCHKQSLRDDLLLKDSVGLVFDYRDIGQSFYFLNEKDSASIYYDKAEQTALALGDTTSLINILLMKVNFFKFEGEYEKALSLNSELLKWVGKTDSVNQGVIYYLQGELYHRHYRLDSAAVYYQKVLEQGNAWAKENASKGLGEIAIMQGRMMDAVGNFNSFIYYADSVNRLQQQEAMMKAHELYNYQLRERENNRLSMENEKKEKWMIVLSSLLLLLSAIICALFRHHRARQLNAQLQITRLKNWQAEQYKSSQKFIEDNNRKIRELQEQLSGSEAQKEQIRQQLQAQIAKLQGQNQLASLTVAEQDGKSMQMAQTAAYKMILSYLKEERIIPDHVWTEVVQAIDKVYEGFSEKLDELHLLNEIDRRVCFLIKMNFTPSEISTLIGRGKSSVSMIRKRLFYKVFGKNGEAGSWDSYIFSL